LPETLEPNGSPDESNASLFLREIALDDAEAAAKLSGELGYPVSVSAMQHRIETIKALEDHVVYVACVSDTVVGWIDVGIVHHLQSDPSGEIGGLVVSSDCRNRGIGKKLIAQAEQWVAHQGISRMVVRSRIARETAHRFYLREGYSRTKTSAVFSKELS
jgi:GNAT superfamily N-acetyltransferase